MHALVIYESMFGNTRKVAEGLATSAKVDLREVGAAPATIEGGVDLLVVGGPTHAFSMSRPRTREDARHETATVSTADGLREWIAALDRSGRRVPVATFDTKVARPNLPGSAARAAERRLRKLGFPIAAAARSFLVDGKTGPLLPGQLERARAWGEELGSASTEHPAQR